MAVVWPQMAATMIEKMVDVTVIAAVKILRPCRNAREEQASIFLIAHRSAPLALLLCWLVSRATAGIWIEMETASAVSRLTQE